MVEPVTEGGQAADSEPPRSWTGGPHLTPDQLARIFSVEEFEPLARERMTPSAYGYVAGGAGTGATTAANREAFSRWMIRPRVLVDVHDIDISTTVLGLPIDLPVLFAPTGYQRLAHTDGELAVARAANRVGTISILSTSSNYSIEEIGAVARNPWYQLYWFTDQDVTRDMIDRAAVAGFKAIVVTVDAPVRLWREFDMKDPAEIPPGVISANVPDRPLKIASNLTWKSLEWLRAISPLPIVLKGILTAEDARLAVEHGVEAIAVSNHGGRALDWAIPSLDALPEVVDAAGGKLEIYVDGGVRRGTDVLKALALGARAVFMGRSIVWGLGTAGEEGVVKTLELVRGEFESVVGLAGVTRMDRIDRSIVTPVPGPNLALTATGGRA